MINKVVLDKLQDDLLVVNRSGDILFCNKHLLKRLQYEALEGEKLQFIIAEKLSEELVSGEDIRFTFKEKSGKKQPASVDIILEKDEKQMVYWLLVKKWHYDNYSREELEYILDQMPYSIWIEDYKGNYRYTNQVTLDEVKIVWGKEISKDAFCDLNTYTMWGDIISPLSWEEDNEDLQRDGIINEIRYTTICGREYAYIMTKLPIKDEEGNIKATICIKNSQVVSKQVEEDLIESYLSYKKPNVTALIKEKKHETMQVRDTLQDVPYMKGPEIMAICEYDSDHKKLNVVGSIGRDKKQLKEIEKLEITGETYLALQRTENINEEQLLEKLLEKQLTSSNLKKSGRGVMHYPIYYKEQCFGILVIAYLEQIGSRYINKGEIRSISRNIAIILNNIKLTEKVNEELALRNKKEQQMADIVDISVGLYAHISYKTWEWKEPIGWQELLGWNSEELMHDRGSHIIHEEDKAEVYGVLKDIRDGKEREEVISRFYCKDGTYKWVKWKARLNEKEDTITIYGIDVTKEMEMLEQRQSYQKALEVEKVKTEFLANMSHEFKTPLNIIYGIIQLIELEIKDYKDDRLSGIEMKKVFRYRNVLKQNIFRLLRLINNIVDISKIEAGAYQIHLQKCDVIEVVEDITMSVVEYTKDKNITILFDTEIEELEMGCDIEKLERIMLNLLSNAVKYSKETGNILVYMKQEGEYIVIHVNDNGVGIPEDKIKTVFDRFVQVDQSFTRRCEGSGIGLSLVKALVELLGGTIKVFSTVGEGTSFQIRLPIVMVPETKRETMKENVSTVNSRIEKCYIEFSDIYNSAR